MFALDKPFGIILDVLTLTCMGIQASNWCIPGFRMFNLPPSTQKGGIDERTDRMSKCSDL